MNPCFSPVCVWIQRVPIRKTHEERIRFRLKKDWLETEQKRTLLKLKRDTL